MTALPAGAEGWAAWDKLSADDQAKCKKDMGLLGTYVIKVNDDGVVTRVPPAEWPK